MKGVFCVSVQNLIHIYLHSHCINMTQKMLGQILKTDSKIMTTSSCLSVATKKIPEKWKGANNMEI